MSEEQDPRILLINTKENDALQTLGTKKDSIINHLAVHHQVLLAYYHENAEIRKEIQALA